MNRLRRIRPGALSVLLALLLGLSGWVSAPRLMAQSSGAGGMILGPGRGGFVSDSDPMRTQPGEHFGKANPSARAQEEEEAVGGRELVQPAMPGSERVRSANEAPSVRREGAPYPGPAAGSQREGTFEFEEAEDEAGPPLEEDEITVEWNNGGREADGTGPAGKFVEAVVPTGAPTEPVPEEEREEREDLIWMDKAQLFHQRLSDPKVSLSLSIDRYRYPDELMQPHWTQCLAVLEDGPIDSLQSSLNGLYDAKLDTGFRNMPEYATLLIRRAYRLLQAGNFLQARLLGEAAYNLAPEYYPVSSSLSRLYVKGPYGSFEKFLHWKWISLKQTVLDFVWEFTTAGKVFALLLMALYLFFLGLGFYFLGRYSKVLLHFVQERLPVGPVGMAVVTALLLATVVVLLLLPGPFWVTVFVGFLAGRFVRRWEKVCYGLFLVVWALSPWLLNQAVCFFSPLSDGTNSIRKCLQGEWDAAGEEALDAAVRANPDSLDLQLTRALVEKRRGDYEEAAEVLRKALLAYPQNGRLWNNLGTLHAVRGNLEEARAAYRKALLYGNGSAAPHYNLSLLLRREFSFVKGAQEYHQARRIDAERVDYLTYIHSPNPNRFFMDEEPRKAALWRYAFYRDSETERAAEDVWRSTAAGIPLRQAPWVFFTLMGAYVLLVSRRSSGHEPFACSGCGKTVCRKCDTGAEVGGLCSPCYQALYQREHISKECRHGQIRGMARYQSRRSRRLLLLNLVLPGLGFSILEETSRGMWVLFGFFYLALLAGFWGAVLPVPMTVWETGESLAWRLLSLLLLILIYGVIQHRFVTKLRMRR